MLRVPRAHRPKEARRPAAIALASLLLVLAPGGCKDDDDDDGSSAPLDLALAQAAAEAFLALADDEVRVSFSRDAVASEATDPAHYAVESPPGNPLPLAGALIAYDPATFTVTLSFAGATAADAVNLAVGAPLRVVASDIHAIDGGVLPAGSTVDVTVVGTNAAPGIVSVTPDRAATAGGVDVTIAATGLTFAADTAVTIGGAPLSGLVQLDSLTVRGRVARGAPGAADVAITNANGSSTLPGAFTFDIPFPLFEAPLSFFTADQPFAVDMGDLDNDGMTDVATVNFISDVIGVYRGRGNGDLDPPLFVQTAARPADILIADMDGSGIADVVYANSGNADGLGNGTVSVRLGLGGLAFAPPTSTTVARSPQSLAIEDLDGDSDLDVAAVNRNTGSLSILLNDGTSLLTRRLPDTTVVGGPNAVTAADVDGDGDADLATANALDAVAIFLNDGSATFTLTPPSLASGDLPQSIVPSDVDGDGLVDLVTANLLSGDASAHFGTGGGAFAPQVSVPLGSRPISVQVSDLFGTGSPHLVTALNLGFGVAYAPYTGARAFGPSTFVRTGRSPQDVAVRPLTTGGSALPAIVSVNRESDTLTLVAHRDDGSLRVPLVIQVGDTPIATALGDFDENGTADIAVIENGAQTLTILLGDGAGVFTALTPIAAGDAPTSIVAANFDADAHLDLLVADMFRNTVLFFRGDGAGGFAAPVSSILGALPEEIAVVDLDKDGDLDVCGTLTGTLTIGVALNDGAGTFVRPTPTSEFGAGGVPQAVFSGGDFDADGNLDLAVAGDAGNGGSVGVLFGDGAGIFNAFGGTLTNENDHTIAMADVNADGVLDLVCAGRNPSDDVSRFRVIIGDGTRILPPSGMGDPRNYEIQVGSSPEHLVLRDVDFDGDPDVILTLAGSLDGLNPIGSSTIGILLNDGTGVFSTAQLLSSGFETRHISAGDLNGDGSADIVGADAAQDTISIYFGRG